MKTKHIDRLIFNVLKVLPFFIMLICSVICIANARFNGYTNNIYDYVLSNTTTFTNFFINNSLTSALFSQLENIFHIGSTNVLATFIIAYIMYLFFITCCQIIYRVLELPLHILNDTFLDKFSRNKDE